eukprot:6122308-Alexandrium_andersonii.AAC.1
MSASLVGSEMCIRDSGLSRAPLRSSTSGRRLPWLIPRHKSSRDHGTVSYTHLTLPTICSV